MRFNKILSRLLFLFLLAAFMSSCGVLKEDSTWQTKPVTTNQVATPWPDSASFKGSDNILYDIRNDKDNLYLCFKTYDPVTQAIIIKGGLTMWFDVLGKKNENIGIAYPLPSDDRRIERRTQRQQGQDDYIPKKQSITPLRTELLLKTQMDLIGFQPNKTVRVPSDTMAGPRANLQFDSLGSLTYVAVIPFASFHYHPLKGKAGRKQKFMVGFVTGHLVLPVQHVSHGSGGSTSGGAGGMGGAMGGGGHMGGGGGRHGGGATTDINDNSDEPIKIWIAVKFPGEKK